MKKDEMTGTLSATEARLRLTAKMLDCQADSLQVVIDDLLKRRDSLRRDAAVIEKCANDLADVWEAM